MDSATTDEARTDGMSSVSVIDTNPTKKTPPPETAENAKTRRWIILSFWIVVAFFGLPTWIWTTTVHRANLPLQAMSNWAEGHACKLEFPLHVAVDAPAMKTQDAQQLARLVQQTLDDHDLSSLHHLRIFSVEHSDKTPAVTVRLTQMDHQVESIAKLRPYEPVLDVYHAPAQGSHTSSLTPLASFVAKELRGLFAEEQDTLINLVTKSGQQVPNSRISSKSLDSLNQRSGRAFNYASTYHITFSLFSGSSSPSAWDIKTAMDAYLTPLLTSFSSINQFTVDTQVQLYASLSPSMRGPTYEESTARWMLQRSDLSSFINAAEWPLSPSIGAGPTINFVLYVPAMEQSPLIIEETGGTSWLIPQWGGVQILNPATLGNHNQSALTEDVLRPVMLAFADQLVSLLGLPHSPSSLPLRLSSLTRERTAELILSASSTLGALARLTLKLTSIAIPDNVADAVHSTIHHLEAACTDLREARYDSALRNARVAEAEAEQAFFEPSMVGQVYFPDEHKVAVYVPLLGPMAVPLLMAGLKELRKVWRPEAKLG